MAPTYVVGLGTLGDSVVRRLEARPPSSQFAAFRVPNHEVADRQKVIGELLEKAADDLQRLLRDAATKGQGSDTGQGKLDLWIVGDVIEAGGSLLKDVADGLSRVMASRFAVMFPPDTAAHQRAVGLVVVLATPALDRSPRAQAALRAVQGLEAWHGKNPPSPILNRVYLLPRQNAVMPLSDEDVERAAYLFISTAASPLLRELDTIRERIAPPRDPARMVDSFAVAAADVEVERIVESFAWRSALSGLTTLTEQMQKPAPRHGSDIDVDGWLRTAEEDLRLGGEKADGAEYDALSTFERDLQQLVDERLGGDDGLLRYREVRDSLEAVAEKLRKHAADDPAWLPDVAKPVDADKPVIETAPAPLPVELPLATAETTLLSGFALALAVGATTAAIYAVATVREVAEATGGGGPVVKSAAAPIGADPVMAIVWGVIAGIAVGLGWAFLSRSSGKKGQGEKDAVEKQEKKVAADNKPKGDARTGALRKRRLARTALALVEDEADRLTGLRQAVIEAHDRAVDKLRSLGVSVGENGASDDYSRLFGAQTPLHTHLVPATALPKLWSRTRAVREDELWAARLLRDAYPRGSHRIDLPFAPGAAWETSLRDQHASLLDDSVFAWPDMQAELGEQIRKFLGAAPRSLELGVRPRNEDGTPATLLSSRDLLLVVPQTGRAVIDRALAEQSVPDARLYPGDDRLARVVMLRTAGEIESARLA